jgi:hypothetical protein
MTPLAQGATGLAVALGFALLVTGRTRGATMLCAAQAVVVAIAALAQHHVAAAALELAEAAALGWLGRTPHHAAPPAVQRFLTRRLPEPPLPVLAVLAAGAVLAALAATVPASGLALAAILLGLLMLASQAPPLQQALGIAAAQNGLVLAAIAADLAGWRLALAVLPWLPGLAFGALWLGSVRSRAAWLRAPRLAAGLDAAASGGALLVACTLPWQLGAGAPFWRLDARAIHVILLLAALSTAASWARRRTTPLWGCRPAILAGTILAVAAGEPLVGWLGMTLAVAGAVADALPERAEVWRRVRLGCTGLGLALFGSIALHAAVPALAGGACVMLGYGALAVLGPELTVAAVALILRTHGGGDDLLLVAGLAGLLVAALGLSMDRLRRRICGPTGAREPGNARHALFPRVMAVEGRRRTTLVGATKESRGWPAFAGHDTGGAGHDAGGASHATGGAGHDTGSAGHATGGAGHDAGGASHATGGAGHDTGGAGHATRGAGRDTGGAGHDTGGAGHDAGGASHATGGADRDTGGAGHATGGAGRDTGGAGRDTGGAGHDTGKAEAERLALVGLAQAGAAAFAFGLGTDAGSLAGLLQLSFLALTQCAVLLAREDGVDRLAALAGLAGVPPFGLFPSLALILAATASRLPWLLLPLGTGLAAIAWTVLLRLPTERRLLPSPAWIPLALLLLAGFAMPDPLLAWFRLAAR